MGGASPRWVELDQIFAKRSQSTPKTGEKSKFRSAGVIDGELWGTHVVGGASPRWAELDQIFAKRSQSTLETGKK